MASQGLTTLNYKQFGDQRLQFLKTVVPSSLLPIVDELNGQNETVAVTTTQAENLVLASSIADLSGDHVAITKALVQAPDVSSLKDIARNYGATKLTKIVKPEQVSGGKAAMMDMTMKAATLGTGTPEPVLAFMRNLFQQEPSAVLAGMISDDIIPVGKPHTKSESPVSGQGAMMVTAAVPLTDQTTVADPEPNATESPNQDLNPVRDGVVRFFDNNKDFNIRQKSILTVLSNPKSLDGVQPEAKDEVVKTLKAIQTTQALTTTPQALPGLMKLGLDSAFKVSQMPEKNFIANYSEPLGGEDVAREIHVHATNTAIRNDHALTSILQTARGSGIAMIDGPDTREQRLEKVKAMVNSADDLPTFESLFGSMDFCECDDCSSVTSPAAYFVEIMQFLRNNNLSVKQPWGGPNAPGGPTGQPGIVSDTPLDYLLRRRPDLGKLELSCANTNTVLPYIDLANEVMESFIVHLQEYNQSPPPKVANIQAFNADPDLEGLGGSSAELLAAPQNINYDAYCILKNTVYPPTKLPFNQPVEAIRLFLDFLGTSRFELGAQFRGVFTPPTRTVEDPNSSCSPPANTPSSSEECSSDTETSCTSSSESEDQSGYSRHGKGKKVIKRKKSTGVAISAECQERLKTLHSVALDRSDDAESLSITEEEYIIITKEAFWVKEHFDIRHGTNFSVPVYQENIGVRPIYAYWGVDYTSIADMLSQDSNLGLEYVKHQFLPRAGIQYTDLVDLLKTEFINPYLPKGRDKVIMEAFRFSYRFLQQAIVPAPCKADSFNLIVEYLFAPGWRQILKNFDAPDVTLLFSPPKNSKKCKIHCHPCDCWRRDALRRWLCKNFERMGKVIVLESQLSDARLAFEANLVVSNVDQQTRTVGRLLSDGRIVSPEDGNHTIARVSLDGVMTMEELPKGKWSDTYKGTQVVNLSDEKDIIGRVTDDTSILTINRNSEAVRWIGQTDDCDLEKVRVRQLNGCPVEPCDYDRMHRFLRLWRKLGWTMVELDAALRVLGIPPLVGKDVPIVPQEQEPTAPEDAVTSDIDWVDFQDSCQNGDCGKIGCKKCKGKQVEKASSPGYSKRKTCHKGCHCHRCCCKMDPIVVADITPNFIHEIVALKQLVDLTGLPFLNILAFFGHIETHGTPSLYSRLFLTHNLLGLDRVFMGDENGNYLATSPPLLVSDHLPVLIAAFQLKPADLVEFRTQMLEKVSNELTLENVSIIYRYSVLARVLGVKIYKVEQIAKTLDINPWTSAQNALDLIKLWNKISDSGFSFQQLDYVLTTADDPLRPVGPSKRTMLQATVSLYRGLNEIDAQHPDIKTILDATTSTVLTNVQLIFAPDVSAQIVGFLEGKLIFATNAPKGLVIAIPPEQTSLLAKLKYADGDQASLQVTGQLTEDEKTRAKALSTSQGWITAIDRTARRAATFLRTTLSGVFTGDAEEKAKEVLLKGDIGPPVDPNAPDFDTAPAKRLFFLEHFIPFLRKKLADKLVIDTIATAVSLDPTLMQDLLTYIIKDPKDDKLSALDALKKIKENNAVTPSEWTGYLVPPTTDSYTLVAESDHRPPDMDLEGTLIPFSDHHDDDDPSNLWASPAPPIRLTGGRLYKVTLKGITSAMLKWKTDSTQLSSIPSSALLADYVTSAVTSLFIVIYKCAIIVNGFSLTNDEILYFHNHSNDFSTYNWNVFNLVHWNRLADYTKLKNSLPKVGLSLIDFFTWAGGPNATTENLPGEIALMTLWEIEDIKSLITPKHFNIEAPSNFRNEISLMKLQKALDISTRIGVPFDLLFTWAQPRIDFWANCAIADSIRISIRSRYKLSDWEVAIKPVYDKLRQKQSDALVAYLIVQPELINQEPKITDADSLFEFFLIDVQMCPCMETSRMKQATSTVQLFIQRCMLGLEPGVNVNALDRDRWEWMQRYRVWEANRKVFLYPENWIQPSLRDDKSPIFLQLESELLQKDLNNETVVDAMKNYLFKLSEVANLEVDAIHVQRDDSGEKLHIIGRSRHSPYKFYYRFFDLETKEWAPWRDMQVDVPYYEVEKGERIGNTSEPADPGDGNTPGGIVEAPPTQGRPGGFYIIPFTFNGRLLVAIPQFMKRQRPAPVPKKTFKDMAEEETTQSLPEEYWEIRMGFTELRKGKWSPKQVTSDTIEDPTPRPATLHPIGSYQFITRKDKVGGELMSVVIDAYRIEDPLTEGAKTACTPIGRFVFSGLQLGKDTTNGAESDPKSIDWTDFQFQRDITDEESIFKWRVIEPLQAPALSSELEYAENYALVKYPLEETDRTSMITYPERDEPERFYHPFVDSLLSTVGRTQNLDDLFKFFTKIEGATPSVKEDAYGQLPAASMTTFAKYNELSRPYSLYNWEIGFHAPMTLVDRLLQNQQFDLALKVCHYVFNPLADGPDPRRFWAWRPFYETNPIDTLEKLFAGLQPNKPEEGGDGQINRWREKPFQPHVVARGRPASYMRWVVMKYIEILIAYGDYYFRQNTLEMIPMAIQCYILASHVYGSPGQKIPKRGKKKVQTYMSLLNKWDAFSNAMVQLELSFPFSNQIKDPAGAVQGTVALANIFGFATGLYFCIPDNPQLRALRTTIDDRLYKIRHCQDIKGVERKLPLYEPAIDPGLLVQAAAAGLDLASVLNDLNSPLPNYRFVHLLRKALEMCEHVKILGKAFIKAKEKKDCEALLALRNRHHGVIQGMVKEQKKLAVDESKKAVEALHQTREQPVYKMKHNLKLLGEDLSKIPELSDAEGAFNELVDQIEAPLVESGMKLIAAEKEEIEKAIESMDLKPIMNALETAASELQVFPTLNGHASPFGVGVATCFGPPNIAKGIEGVSKAYAFVSDLLSNQSSNVSRRQNLVKQNQARQKQANESGHEVKTIDKQILTHEIKIAATEQDLSNQEQEISNAQDIEDFLKDKYTRTELYQWIEQSVSALYYQTYTVAYDWAKKAEMAYRFERSIQDTNFIKFGYWETANSGLHSGERLFMGLKEIEAAYHENKGYDFEIKKYVSLRSINPFALFKLREDSSCDFAIPEILFDMDFPGHYQRKLKSAAVTVRCTSDPFTNINCTLRLQSHKYRYSPLAASKADYPEKTDQDDDRFRTANIPIPAIAVSTGQNDPGVFELDFKDERYMPFEGAGAISTWRLELPDAFKQFDYQSITDIVIHLQYTSMDGGKALGVNASAAVGDYIKSVVDISETEGLYAVFDIPHDFPTEWANVISPTAPTPRMLTLENVSGKLPVYTKGKAPDKIVTKDMWVISDVAISPGGVTFVEGGNTLGFTRADRKAGTKLTALHSSDPCAVKNWNIGIGELVLQMGQFWIVARYSLKG